MSVFSIDEHEVTVGRFARLVEATGSVALPDGWQREMGGARLSDRKARQHPADWSRAWKST